MAEKAYDPLEVDDETEEEVKEDEHKLKLLESIEKSDLHWVLSDVRGRRVLWRIIGERVALEQSYVPGSFDQTAYNEGQRSVAIELFKEINEISEELYLKMMKEAKKFKVKRRKDRGNAR